MKRILSLAAMAGVAMALSVSPAAAWKKHSSYGGSAKFYAQSAADAWGTVRLNNRQRMSRYGKKKSGGCGCEGSVEVTNESNQYHSNYKRVKRGSTTVGGESGSINLIGVKWTGGRQNVKIESSSSAYGSSRLSSRRFGGRR